MCITFRSRWFPGSGTHNANFPFSVLTVKGDSFYRTAADLDGKTVALSALSDLTAYGVKAWMRTAEIRAR